MFKALYNRQGQGQIKHVCPSCGMLIPKYKGKYPNHCPTCTKPLGWNEGKDKDPKPEENYTPAKEFDKDGNEITDM